MHGTIDSLFRVEWRPLAELGAHRRGMAALAAPRARAERLLRARLRARRRAGVRARRRRRPGLVAGDAARGCSACFRRGSSAAATACALPVLVGWTHPYAPLGTPLVDRELGEAVIAAWFDHLAQRSAAAEPDAAALLSGAKARWRGRSMRACAPRRRQRAVRAPPARAAGAWPSARRLSRPRHRAQEAQGAAPAAQAARRQRRRDARAARASRRRCATRSTISLALEAGGWKGRAGTAARARRRHRQVHGGGGRRDSPAKARRGSTGCSSTRAPIAAIGDAAAAARPRGAGRSPTTRALRASRRACSSSLDVTRDAARRSRHRARRFLRHRRSSDDRPRLARAPRCSPTG